MRLAYNTNGTAHHRLDDALVLIADSGYQGVALTLDHHHLDPFAPDFRRRAEALARRLEQLRLGLVVETGARFLLDPRHKHEPTLISPDPAGRGRRVDFLCRAVDVAAVAAGEAVSFWAGVPRPGVDRNTAWDWLVAGVAAVADYARSCGVVVAFEPEPGMLVETVEDFYDLKQRLAQVTDAPLTLALDTGHCLVTQDRDPAEAVVACAGDLGTVSLEDMARGVHVHLPFGEGDMDVAAVLAALEHIAFSKLVCVELSRDSHRAHTMVPEAKAWLDARLAALTHKG